MRSRQPAGWGTERVPTRDRPPVLAWPVLGWHLVAWSVVCGWRRARACGRAVAQAWRSALVRHPALRFAQIAPLGLVLWGLDDAASLRAGAAGLGLRHAVAVNSVSLSIGGRFALVMNDWLAVHHLGALAATYYYILLQGALTGVLGALLIWRRVPSFALHRNALIAVTALGLVAFWCFPVAPPRLLPGYHDIVASALPAFSAAVEPNGSAVYASLPSLHVAWAIWGAIAGTALVRRPVLRALLWLYPAATITDVLATANHYLLDAITAVGLLVMGYVLAVAAEHAHTHLADRRAVRGVSSPGAIRLAYGASSIPGAATASSRPLTHVGYWASPQAIDRTSGGPSPQAIDGTNWGPSPQAIDERDGPWPPHAIDGTSRAPSPQPIDPTYRAPSPQPIDPTSRAPSPQPIDPTSRGPSPQPIDPTSRGPSPQPIDRTSRGPSPQPIDRTKRGPSARGTRPHGAVLVCSLPEADCRGSQR